MGRDLAESFACARAVFDEVDDRLGFGLSRLCFEGPAETLALTEHAQPAILAASMAAFRVLQEATGLVPHGVAGHSLGEWSALVAANALGLGDAAHGVRERGRLMQQAVPVGVGAMAALLGIDLDQAQALCREAAQGEVVAPANLNGGGQIVIAGHASAVRRAVAGAKARGAKRTVELAVSAPFHCALMKPAADGLAEVLESVTVRSPKAQVITNVTADVNVDPQRVKDLLVQQVTAPVQWEESMRKLHGLGCTATVEVGPGKVLAGLLKRIVPDLPCVSISDPESLAEAQGVLA